MKLIVLPPDPGISFTVASVPVGSVFSTERAWYLKLSRTEDCGRTEVWSLDYNYKTYFNSSQDVAQVATSVEVRVTP